MAGILLSACLAFSGLFVMAFPATAGQKPVSLELYFECMDSAGWQWFFTVNALERRSDAVGLDVVCLVSKKNGEEWTSPREKAEIEESMRIAVISQIFGDKLLLYLNGRSLSPWRGGWIDAAVFAQINPDELADKVAAKGGEALEKNFARARKRGAESKALFINGEKYGGEMKLAALMEKINGYLPAGKKFVLYENRKTKIEAQKLWILVDNEFASKNDAVVSTFQKYFTKLQTQIVDYSQNKNFGVDFIPAYVMEENENTMRALERFIEAGVFKKTEKKIIYYDKSSRGVFVKREKKKDVLEVFIMSQCPYGVQAVNSLIEAEKNSSLPKGLKLQLHYILNAEKSGGEYRFKSLRGDPEWRENARQLYIAQKFPSKFFGYLEERNRNYSSDSWKEAAEKAGIDPEAITENFDEAKELLYEDARYTDSLGISSSPTFVVDGRKFLVGLNRLIALEGYGKITQKAAAGACE